MEHCTLGQRQPTLKILMSPAQKNSVISDFFVYNTCRKLPQKRLKWELFSLTYFLQAEEYAFVFCEYGRAVLNLKVMEFTWFIMSLTTRPDSPVAPESLTNVLIY